MDYIDRGSREAQVFCWGWSVTNCTQNEGRIGCDDSEYIMEMKEETDRRRVGRAE